MWQRQWGSLVLLVMLAACAPQINTNSDDANDTRVIREITVEPAASSVAASVGEALAIVPTPILVTPEQVSPLQQVTVDADFVLVTPTLPPSKTPTRTPTMTQTPTVTPTPTLTGTASATAFLLPTSEIIALTDVVAAPNNRICDSNWFFIQPRPDSCPLAPPNASPGVFQRFENGFMIWVGSQDAIYVLYNDPVQPRWQVFRDFFNEGMPEDSPQYVNAPRPNIWQPRRGFGLLWRDNATIRNRIGWAAQQWEQPYSVQVQTANDGTIFISQPGTSIFGLLPNNVNWNQFSTSGSGLPAAGDAPVSPLTFPTLPPPPS